MGAGLEARSTTGKSLGILRKVLLPDASWIISDHILHVPGSGGIHSPPVSQILPQLVKIHLTTPLRPAGGDPWHIRI